MFGVRLTLTMSALQHQLTETSRAISLCSVLPPLVSRGTALLVLHVCRHAEGTNTTSKKQRGDTALLRLICSVSHFRLEIVVHVFNKLFSLPESSR